MKNAVVYLQICTYIYLQNNSSKLMPLSSIKQLCNNCFVSGNAVQNGYTSIACKST